MMKLNDAVNVLKQHRGDAVVVTCMSAGGAWARVSDRPERDLPIRPMGKASNIAFGLAMSRPDLKVIMLDGDGSLLMNLGTLTTVATQKPENFYHFVMENGVYAITGGQPIPGKDVVSFAGFAKDAGYAACYEFDDLEELSLNIGKILQEKGPVLINLKVEAEISNTPPGLRPAARRDWRDNLRDVQAHLNKK
ncbi:MAG: thiamine pyrophosphate-binding protein [Chloroflexi bacterium]|nr:thiamine pyrophosphate-binding protein [Chloroflexota bacterium]